MQFLLTIPRNFHKLDLSFRNSSIIIKIKNIFYFYEILIEFHKKLKDLKTQTVKTKPFKIKVCRNCWDPDQPQLQLGMYPVDDPQAVQDPRPDYSQ